MFYAVSDEICAEVIMSGDVSKYAYYNDIIVGAICCRRTYNEFNEESIYVLILVVLEPYQKFVSFTISCSGFELHFDLLPICNILALFLTSA